MGKHPWLTELTKGDNEMRGPAKAMNVLSWNDCQAFVAALQNKAAVSIGEEYKFALPTEAQWEYACRAGSTAEFHFGDDESQLGEYAWYEGNMNWLGKPSFRGKAFYHDVGRMKPNAWGLYGMHGGVWEWCAFYYDEDYYRRAPQANPLKDPQGPKGGSLRVYRVGRQCRHSKPTDLRPNSRCASSPLRSSGCLGFRCVKSK